MQELSFDQRGIRMTRDEMLKGTRGDSAYRSDALQEERGYKMLGLLHTVPKYSILAITLDPTKVRNTSANQEL